MNIQRWSMSFVTLAFLIGGMHAAHAQGLDTDIVIGERISIFSEHLDEERTILVGKPDGYEASTDSYALLVVLDGAAHFHQTTGLTRFLARNQLAPGMLVVSIENTIRSRDLTPPSEEPVDIENFPIRGGAERFQTFIADELIPWVDQNYRTRPYRILIGHSHGGLFAIFSLVTRPDVFDAYVAISPSLQWDGQRFVDRAGALLSEADEVRATLYMTAGNEGGEMLGGIRKLAAALDAKQPLSFEWKFEHMPLETHGSVPMRSTYRGLEFIFSDWTLGDPLNTYNRFGVEAIEAFYEASDAKYGVDRGAPLVVLTRLAVALRDTGRLDEVMELMGRYGDQLQAPPRALIGIADRFRERGQTNRAADVYQMVLDAGPRAQNEQDASALEAAARALQEIQ